MARFKVLSIDGQVYRFMYSFNDAPWGELEIDFDNKKFVNV